MPSLAAAAKTLTIAELSSRERSYLSKEHPEIADLDAALVVAAKDTELLKQALALVESSQRRSERMTRTIEAMLPSEIPSSAAVLQARRNAEARQALLREFGALTSADVADLVGSRAKNRAALANRWHKEGRIFSLLHHGQTFFAGFQFGQDGQPFPVVAEVMRAFGQKPGEGWQMALWFTGANGWLGGARPVDLLATDPERIADAARHEMSDFVF